MVSCSRAQLFSEFPLEDADLEHSSKSDRAIYFGVLTNSVFLVVCRLESTQPVSEHFTECKKVINVDVLHIYES